MLLVKFKILVLMLAFLILKPSSITQAKIQNEPVPGPKNPS